MPIICLIVPAVSLDRQPFVQCFGCALPAIYVCVLCLAAPYLCVVTSSSLIGRGPNNASFYCVNTVEFLRFQNTDVDHHVWSLSADEREFIAMMKSVLESRTFYYSPNYEITHTAQRT
jgi:hypothetical protein